MRRVYDSLTWRVLEKWIGTLQAAAAVRSLYLHRTLARLLRLTDDLRILDAGSGEQAALTRVLARRYPSHRFVALDLYMQDPREGHLPLPENVEYVEQDIIEYEPVEQFDFIICLDVLEHIEDASGAISLFYEWNRTGGYLIVHVPSDEQLIYLVKNRPINVTERGSRPGDEHVRDGYGMGEIQRDVEHAGYSVVQKRFTFSAATWLIKEVYSVLEGKRIKGIGIALLPILCLSVRIEMFRKLKRGNGILVLARKT